MMFSFPAIPEVDFEAPANGKGLRGTKHAGEHDGSGKDSLFETDADAGAVFARLLEDAFGCKENDPEALRQIVSKSREAGVDPSDLGKLFQVLGSFVPMHAGGLPAGGAAASDTGLAFLGEAEMPADLSDGSERPGRILAGLAARSTETGVQGVQVSSGEPLADQTQRNMTSQSNTGVLFPGGAEMPADLSDGSERPGRILAGLAPRSTEAGGQGVQTSPGEPAADQAQRNMASEHPRQPGVHAEGADAALARIVSAFSRNAGETQSLERHAAKTAESGYLIGEGRTEDGSTMKKAVFVGESGRMEDARVRLPEMSGDGSGGSNEKAAARSGKESQKMRAYLDSLADQLTTGGKKEPDGRMGLKMTGFKEGIAGASQQTGESARAQGASGSQTNGAAASLTGSMSGPLPLMGAETPAFGGDGSFQGAMAESSGGKAAPAATDAGNPGSPSAAAFDKHLQSPLQALENRVMGQVFMRLFTGAGRGTSSMTLNIHPPELGSVRVRIVSEHGRMSVHLNAQTQQVAGILERNLPALHQSLADQGIDIDDLHVSVDSGEGENAGFEEHAFTGRPAGNPSSGLDESGDTAADHPPEPGYTEGRGLSLRV